MEPQIVIQDVEGLHNTSDYRRRLREAKTYQDLSTIQVVATRGVISAKVVQSWQNLMTPMNQKFMRMYIIGYEVGEAYNQAINSILSHPDLSNWQYILTLEEDNMPPPDGMLKLYEGMDDFDVVGGLYWTKGEGGQPMIYGDPYAIPENFIPQMPRENTIQHCAGLGMGFNLFKMSIFKDDRVPKPWFKTLQTYTPGVGAAAMTQDLYFFQNIKKLGYKVACHTGCKVGHYDIQNDIVW